MKITHTNLTQIYPTLDQSILPKQLQQNEYLTVVENLDLYNESEDIEKWIDTFCKKLSDVTEKHTASQKKSNVVIITKTEKKPERVKKPLTEKTVKAKTLKVKSDKTHTIKANVKKEKQNVKAVSKIAPDVAFIKRYANLHNKTKTKQQILTFIKSIQKAIAEKVLRKSDKYAEHIENIQKQLTKCYRSMGRTINVSIDEKMLQKYREIAKSVVISDSVKMFKAFLRFLSNPDETSAKLILTKSISPKNSLEQSVVRSLQDYIKSGTCEISEQALNGIYDVVGDDEEENMFGTHQKKKNVCNANVVNSEDFAKMRFDTLPLSGNFQKLIGTPSTNFKMMVYGSPGSGKTTLCLMFADNLCKYHNKNVLFATIEEGLNHTFQSKLKRMNATNPKLNIATHLPADLTPFDVIVLDSVNTFGLDSKELHLLYETYPDKIFIGIFQTTKNGVFRGSREFQHDCDVVVEVKNGVATTVNQKNRFGQCGTFEIF